MAFAAVVSTHSSRGLTPETPLETVCLLCCVQIDAKPSLPHGEHSSPKSKKIFVGGLAPETTEGKGALQVYQPAAAGGGAHSATAVAAAGGL